MSDNTSSNLSTTVPSTWYEDFFTELPNEFWRRAVTPETTAAEVEFVERHLDLAPRSSVLDVPCGSGRHSLALASRGHRVTGVDGSAETIDHARASAADAGLGSIDFGSIDFGGVDFGGVDFGGVDFVLADMRDIPRDGSFDAAVCLGNSFGYLPPAGIREFVAALAGAVRPGGGLVVDFSATAETVLPGFTGEPRTMRTGDITVEATTEYDVATSCLISRYRFSRGSEVLDTTALHHVYTSAYLGELLTDGGFTVVGRWADPDGTPYRLGAARLLLVAQRA